MKKLPAMLLLAFPILWLPAVIAIAASAQQPVPVPVPSARVVPEKMICKEGWPYTITANCKGLFTWKVPEGTKYLIEDKKLTFVCSKNPKPITILSQEPFGAFDTIISLEKPPEPPTPKPEPPVGDSVSSLRKDVTTLQKSVSGFQVSFSQINAALAGFDRRITDLEKTPIPPTPPVPPKPDPPTPKASKVYVLVFDNVMTRLGTGATRQQIDLMTDVTYWNSKRAAGHEYRNLDVNNPDAAPWKTYIEAAGGPPCVIIVDVGGPKRKLAYKGRLPADKAGMEALLNGVLGTAPTVVEQEFIMQMIDGRNREEPQYSSKP